MNKPTTEPSEASTTASLEKEEAPKTTPRVKALLAGGIVVKSGVRAGSGPKLPPSHGE